ncbi:zinc finger CCCH domain-containing protein 67-like isoform X1 [Rhododendron vialii]|uniref:zinc finger CCCH domain-containing protein 67-like isoform X1 n=1 Tax=Rhododendron vialii TaxID=182163 RepID=UPI00265F30C0|nr:zinc finger CCCH domain-containing protein 67-like isoform X1 [Rhododendron vialii]
METFESITTSSDPKPRSDEQSLDFDGLTVESLSQKLDNVGLGSNEGQNINGNDRGGVLHPLRPHAEDCPHYVRTGTCKFGLNCRFNHPVTVRRANQKWGKEKEKEKAKEGVLEKPENIECKYYLTAEGCKYGKSCRYNHSKAEAEIAPPELNFLGLPIRLGEKECPFYMRNGSCGYGPRCRFHHPNPTGDGGHDPNSSPRNDECSGQFSLPAIHYNGESIPLNASGASHPAQASWSTHVLSDKAVPYYQENHSAYMSTMHFLPQEALPTPEWNGYQAPYFPDESTWHILSLPAAKETYISSQVEEYPERPGVPECDFFKRTGTCKYKSACRYHHPKNQAPKADCVLNDKGLPLRPGRKICRYYEQLGICKFGPACLFDHPVNQNSTFLVRPPIR